MSGAAPGADEEDVLMPLARRVAENRPLRPTEHGQFVLIPHNDTEKYRDVAWTCIGHIANVAEASRKMSAAERADAVVDCRWWTEEADFTEAGTVGVNTQMDVLLPAVPGIWNTHMLTANATCGVLFALQDFVPDAATGAALVREMETLGGGMGVNIPTKELSAQGVKFIGRYDWDYYRRFPPAGETLEEGFPWPARDGYDPFDGPTVFLAQTTSILTKLLPWFAAPEVMEALGDFTWQPREGETQEQYSTRQGTYHERREVVLPGGLLTVDSPSDDAAAPPAGAVAHFAGAEYMFGRVWFEPDGRRARALLAFNYNMPDLFADTELGGVPVGPLVEGFPESVPDEDLAACVVGTTRPRLTKCIHRILTDPVQMQRVLTAAPQLADPALVIHAVSGAKNTATMVVLKAAQESGVLKKMADHDHQMVEDPTAPDIDANERGVRATYDIYAKCRLKDHVNFLLQSGYPLHSSVSQNMWDEEQTFNRKPFLFLYPAPEVMDVVLGSLPPEQSRVLVNEVYKCNTRYGHVTPLEDALLSEGSVLGPGQLHSPRTQRIGVLLKYGADLETVGAAREAAKEEVVGRNAMDLSARAALQQVIAGAMEARRRRQFEWTLDQPHKKRAAEPPTEAPAYGAFGIGAAVPMVQPPPNVGVAEAEAVAEQVFNHYRAEVDLLRERSVRCCLTYDDVNKSLGPMPRASSFMFGTASEEVDPWEEEFTTKWKTAIRKLYWQ